MAEWLWETGRGRILGSGNFVVHFGGARGAPTSGAQTWWSAVDKRSHHPRVTDQPADVSCPKCQEKIRIRRVR